MKTIEQLLELSKNPFYKFTPEEEQALNSFLSKKQEESYRRSQKRNSKRSEDNTDATANEHRTNALKFRNIVEKTIPGVEESGR